jgi:predicted membrane-bound spermidine synthase
MPVLILASFIEGGCLMAFEILSVKIYTPFLGASMYVWTSILAVTLLGLAVGYRAGGYFAGKDSKDMLAYSFLLSGLLVFLSTFTVKLFSPVFLNTGIKMASLLAGCIVLFFPVFFMGIISPMIVRNINKVYNDLARSTGIIYGTGTFGGIIFILVTVYFFIPVLGVKSTTFLLGTLLMIPGFYFKMKKNNFNEKN